MRPANGTSISFPNVKLLRDRSRRPWSRGQLAGGLSADNIFSEVVNVLIEVAPPGQLSFSHLRLG